MVKYLIDSDIVIAFLKGSTGAVALLSRLNLEGIAVSAVTCAEVFEGLVGARNPGAQRQAFNNILRRAAVLPVDLPVAERFAAIRAELRASGMLIPDMDLLIAATALTHDLTLVTGNLRHFDRVPGLRIHPSP